MNVIFVDGPLEGQFMEVRDNSMQVTVATYPNGKYSLHADPADLDRIRPLVYVDYRVHMCTMVSHPFRGIGYAAKVASGPITDRERFLHRISLDRIEEVTPPDFITDFDGWFERQVAIHCTWTWQHKARDLAFKRLLQKWEDG